MRLDAYIYLFSTLELKTRIALTCLAITAKAFNRSVDILLRSLLCIRFTKEKDLATFLASNRKDTQYMLRIPES